MLTGRYELVNGGGTWVGPMRGDVTSDPRRHDWHIDLAGTDGIEGFPALPSGNRPAGGGREVEGFVSPGPLPVYPESADPAE